MIYIIKCISPIYPYRCVLNKPIVLLPDFPSARVEVSGLYVCDKLLLEHVGLPHVLDLAVHLVNFFGWVSQGGHSEPLLLLALFYQSTPSCLKVMGGWGGWVAHKTLLSSPVPIGIGIWAGLGLDNI